MLFGTGDRVLKGKFIDLVFKRGDVGFSGLHGGIMAPPGGTCAPAPKVRTWQGSKNICMGGGLEKIEKGCWRILSWSIHWNGPAKSQILDGPTVREVTVPTKIKFFNKATFWGLDNFSTYLVARRMRHNAYRKLYINSGRLTLSFGYKIWFNFSTAFCKMRLEWVYGKSQDEVGFFMLPIGWRWCKAIILNRFQKFDLCRIVEGKTKSNWKTCLNGFCIVI